MRILIPVLSYVTLMVIQEQVIFIFTYFIIFFNNIYFVFSGVYRKYKMYCSFNLLIFVCGIIFYTLDNVSPDEKNKICY